MLKRLVLRAITFYKQTEPTRDAIGAQLFMPKTACRFQPTCSEYAYEAVNRYGAAKGVWLGLRRFLRCGPWSPPGYDPVP